MPYIIVLRFIVRFISIRYSVLRVFTGYALRGSTLICEPVDQATFSRGLWARRPPPFGEMVRTVTGPHHTLRRRGV